jgi:hypothetical protein
MIPPVPSVAFGSFRQSALLSPHEIEVLAIGVLKTVSFEGGDPIGVARSVLEDFLLSRAGPIRTIEA